MKLSNKQIGLLRATDFQSDTVLQNLILIKKQIHDKNSRVKKGENYYQTIKTSFHQELGSLFLKKKKRKSP